MSWDVQSIAMGTGMDHSLWIGGFPQQYIPGKLSLQAGLLHARESEV